MRFDDLRTFALVSKSGSLHAAARSSGTTQSSITKAIQRLESQFDLRLLNRSRRGIELTAAGNALLERTQHIELGIVDLHAEMHAMRSAERGAVRLGTIPALLEPALIPLLSMMRKTRPQVTFNLEVQTSARLLTSVQSGQLDFALALMPSEVPDELQAEHLGWLRYHVVGRLGHPLADRPLDLQSLSKAEWLLPPRNVGMRAAIDQCFVDAGIHPPSAVIQADTSSAWFSELLRQTDMVAAFTELMMSSRLGQGLQVLPFSNLPLSSDLRLFYRRNAFLSPALQEVRALLKTITSAREQHN